MPPPGVYYPRGAKYTLNNEIALLHAYPYLGYKDNTKDQSFYDQGNILK